MQEYLDMVRVNTCCCRFFSVTSILARSHFCSLQNTKGFKHQRRQDSYHHLKQSVIIQNITMSPQSFYQLISYNAQINDGRVFVLITATVEWSLMNWYYEDVVFLTDRMTVKFCVLAIWCWAHESTLQRCSFKARYLSVVFDFASTFPLFLEQETSEIGDIFSENVSGINRDLDYMFGSIPKRIISSLTIISSSILDL